MKDLMVGLGEIGMPLYRVFSRKLKKKKKIITKAKGKDLNHFHFLLRF